MAMELQSFLERDGPDILQQALCYRNETPPLLSPTFTRISHLAYRDFFLWLIPSVLVPCAVEAAIHRLRCVSVDHDSEGTPVLMDRASMVFMESRSGRCHPPD